MLTPQNHPTVTVVGFLLAVLALSLASLTMIQSRGLAEHLARIHLTAGIQHSADMKAFEDRFKALEESNAALSARLDALAASAAAPAPPR